MKTKLTTIILACCGLFAAGCKPKTGSNTTKSELTASTGGRDIHIISEGGAWVNQQENEFTVKVTGHEIIISREQVLVDKKEGAKGPAGAKKFEMNFADGTLTLSADGTEILNTPLKK